LTPAKSLFDYGCGHGKDIEILRAEGIECTGWDPFLLPSASKRKADIVNLGYVINVIEDKQERRKTLSTAWDFSKALLVVAAQIEFAAPAKHHEPYGDGIVTSRRTFQKYYGQSELRSYIEDTLQKGPVPAAPGVFYVFRNESDEQRFLARRFHRRVPVPRAKISELKFAENRDILEPLMESVARLGRLPGPEETPLAPEIEARFGSLKQAFAVVCRATDDKPWEEIAERRTEDLLVYLALSKLSKRSPFSQLPLATQRDVKSFFGTYRSACAQSDELLFRAGDPSAIDKACIHAPVGKLLDNALVLHRSGLSHLPPLLRIYEGCARALTGSIEDADLVKLHRSSGKITYLSYSNFDRDPHPTLQRRIKVTLPTLSIDFFDYSHWEDPQILSSKHGLLHPQHAFYKKFAGLARQEEKYGLLERWESFTTRGTFAEKLRGAGLELHGHRLRKSRGPAMISAPQKRQSFGDGSTGMLAYTDVETHELDRLIRSGKLAFAGHKRLRIYGTLECQGSGKRMGKEHLVFFETDDEARSQGFRPCGSCLKEEYRAWKKEQASS
jgi:DNA phosphorothioation-associated putative methyltransferase